MAARICVGLAPGLAPWIKAAMAAAVGAAQYGAGVSAAKLEGRKGRVVGNVRVRSQTFTGVRR